MHDCLKYCLGIVCTVNGTCYTAHSCGMCAAGTDLIDRNKCFRAIWLSVIGTGLNLYMDCMTISAVCAPTLCEYLHASSRISPASEAAAPGHSSNI